MRAMRLLHLLLQTQAGAEDLVEDLAWQKDLRPLFATAAEKIKAYPPAGQPHPLASAGHGARVLALPSPAAHGILTQLKVRNSVSESCNEQPLFQNSDTFANQNTAR